jgi:DNA polymerase III sliding clamp (beta) subunit (PCNA family)
MKVNREQMLNVLAKVKPGLAKKEVIEEMGNFFFTGDFVAAYNGQVCVIHDQTTDFKGSVPADTLYKLLSKVTDDEIEITVEDDKMKLKSPSLNSELSMVLQSEIEEVIKAIDSNNQEIGWKDVPKDFADGAALCAFSASKDDTLGTLTCVMVRGDMLYSCDNIRTSKYKMEANMAERLFIKASTIKELVDYKLTKYKETEAWIIFWDEGSIIFCVRKIIGEYPDVEQLYQMEYDKGEIPIPATLKKSIDVVSLAIDGDSIIDKSVIVKIESGVITCRGRNAKGFIEHKTPVEYAGEPFTFRINPLFLYQVTDKASTLHVGGVAVMLVSDNFKHVLSLVVDSTNT